MIGKIVAFGLVFFSVINVALATDKVWVKVIVPEKIEINSGERVKVLVVVEAGGARISAVDLKLNYDTTKLTIEEVKVSGSEIQKMMATASGGVVNLAGGVFAKDLPSGTINFGYMTILAKVNTRIDFRLEQMEVVGYGQGSSEAGVVSEYGGVVARETSSAYDCVKAKLDLSGQKVGVADGGVNLLDYSFAKTRAVARAETETGGMLAADINGDCIENMADLGLVIRKIVLEMENL